MKPMDELKAEHEGVLAALRILEAINRLTAAGRAAPGEHLAALLDFLKVFVDRCHHGKEEDLLFPALLAAGLPLQGGPVQVMLAEHETGRGLVREMAAAAGREPLDQVGFTNAAAAYVDLLRRHIDKENNVLFVLAERLLAPEIQTRLAEGFERIEAERVGPGKHEAYHRMLHDLTKVYLGQAS